MRCRVPSRLRSYGVGDRFNTIVRLITTDTQKYRGAAASFVVGRYKPGRRRSAKQVAKKGHAEEFRRAKENELVRALIGTADRTWSEFRDEYESQLLSQQKPGTVDRYVNLAQQASEVAKLLVPTSKAPARGNIAETELPRKAR